MKPLFLDRPYDRIHAQRESDSPIRYASAIERYDGPAGGPVIGSRGDRFVMLGIAFCGGFGLAVLLLT